MDRAWETLRCLVAPSMRSDASWGMDEPRWIDHTADVGAALRADSLAGLFQVALDALVGAMMASPPRVADDMRRIVLEAPSPERLLVRWLEEWIYLVQAAGRVPVESAIRIEKRTGGIAPAWRLEAEVRDAALDPGDHAWKTEIKGATYHGLDVREEEDGWTANVVFDV